ncbi:hypothetical protein WS91_20970 [Burkholderia sp. MSMB1498]|nr:hypothetical protein WS91_20970 [Burkholderia sp. MSMB1498]
MTSPPAASTTPAPSKPSTAGSDATGYGPLRKSVSTKFAPITVCSMRTSSGPGGERRRRWPSAFIVELLRGAPALQRASAAAK